LAGFLKKSRPTDLFDDPSIWSNEGDASLTCNCFLETKLGLKKN
jgi:hypothetical protein